MTNVDPRISTLLLDAHSAMIVDVYTPLATDGTSSVMQPAWAFMLTAPIAPPVPGIAIELSEFSADILIQVTSQSGFLYQLQHSTDLNDWSNCGAEVVDQSESSHLQWLISGNTSMVSFWRVTVRYR
jgi:hypothetical protein